jgi:hypothetical protein
VSWCTTWLALAAGLVGAGRDPDWIAGLDLDMVWISSGDLGSDLDMAWALSF